MKKNFSLENIIVYRVFTVETAKKKCFSFQVGGSKNLMECYVKSMSLTRNFNKVIVNTLSQHTVKGDNLQFGNLKLSHT